MRHRGLRLVVCSVCLGLACALAAPTRAEARGHGHGWGWALPLGAMALTIAGLTYYHHRGVYYQPAYGGYVVVPPPAGVVAVQPVPVMASPADPAVGEVAVVAPSLNVRSGPGYNHSVVAVVDQGTALQVLSSSEGWLWVRTPGGQMGWVVQQYTRPSLPPANG